MVCFVHDTSLLVLVFLPFLKYQRLVYHHRRTRLWRLLWDRVNRTAVLRNSGNSHTIWMDCSLRCCCDGEGWGGAPTLSASFLLSAFCMVMLHVIFNTRLLGIWYCSCDLFIESKIGFETAVCMLPVRLPVRIMDGHRYMIRWFVLCACAALSPWDSIWPHFVLI